MLGDHNGFDESGSIKVHFLDADDPVVPVRLPQRSSVIHDVPFVGARRMQDRMMTSARGDRCVLLQNPSNAIERPERGRPDGVGHCVIRAGPAAFGPHEIVLPILHDHEGTFDVTFGRDLLKRRPIGEGNEAREFALQLRDVAVPPATISDVV